MACALTQGFPLDCRDNVGGIKQIYVIELSNVSSFAPSNQSGIITSITMVGLTKFWTYAFEKETGSFEDGIQTSDPNGTVFYEPTVNIMIRKMQAASRNELKLLAQNRLAIIVLDRNGKYWAVGFNNGMELQPSKVLTGKAMGDFNGYELVFKGKEEQPAQEISASIISGIVQ
jgi:hypothetical protein